MESPALAHLRRRQIHIQGIYQGTPLRVPRELQSLRAILRQHYLRLWLDLSLGRPASFHHAEPHYSARDPLFRLPTLVLSVSLWMTAEPWPSHNAVIAVAAIHCHYSYWPSPRQAVLVPLPHLLRGSPRISLQIAERLLWSLEFPGSWDPIPPDLASPVSKPLTPCCHHLQIIPAIHPAVWPGLNPNSRLVTVFFPPPMQVATEPVVITQRAVQPDLRKSAVHFVSCTKSLRISYVLHPCDAFVRVSRHLSILLSLLLSLSLSLPPSLPLFRAACCGSRLLVCVYVYRVYCPLLMGGHCHDRE